MSFSYKNTQLANQDLFDQEPIGTTQTKAQSNGYLQNPYSACCHHNAEEEIQLQFQSRTCD